MDIICWAMDNSAYNHGTTAQGAVVYFCIHTVLCQAFEKNNAVSVAKLQGYRCFCFIPSLSFYVLLSIFKIGDGLWH
ncbi:hypothetical protein BJY04DRAFT_195890 [Aspergillus karnatakaensis]|uniref:uncharacterized protein n=1 Tax=Aspergillus karnatakaensis TaxID=1810916 RepID=UPI003CCD274A